ncbi:hypothetical protein VUR80DRAFT_2213 [Thermomyces stellatus]
MGKRDDTSEAGSLPRASPDIAEAQTSKKRKSNLEEIEVDLNLPEPPSKKARRALKKGKALSSNSKKSHDDKDEDAAEGASGNKAKTRSEHGVWIGNLPFDATPMELRRWLIANSGGAITEESITRMRMPMNKDKVKARGEGEKPKSVNKGFAYVDFDGPVPQMAAIALSETALGLRNLLIKDSKSFEGRPKVEKAAGADKEAGGQRPAQEAKNANPKVFVGNLGFDTTEDDLWAHFEKCGDIDWVKVATFEDTGKCKGYGWVRFKTPEAAEWATKGFVKIKEAIETEEDFQESEGDSAEKETKYKTRKWWVNRLKGRALKIELAEDDQTRYKKRFKKEGKGKKGQAGGGGPRGGPDYIEDAVKSAMAAESAAA